MTRGPLIVLAGPSGVGKTTLAERLIAACPYPLRRAITATTRQPRPGERPDFDYHFWSRERFQSEVNAGQMLEWAEVHGSDLYGTPRAEVDPHRNAGTGVLLVIDVQGAAHVRTTENDHVSVFVLPPSFASLETRLTLRGDAPDRVARRLRTAIGEIARAGEFDRIVVNADIFATVRILTDLAVREFRTRG